MTEEETQDLPELAQGAITRAGRSFELAKLQKKNAEAIALEMGCSKTDDNFNLVLATLMQVLATNQATFTIK